MEYQKCEITGYIYNLKSSRFGIKMYLQTLKDETGIKYPQHMLATVSAKHRDIIDPAIKEGDKVKLEVVPWLSEGVSSGTGKAYSVCDLRIAKCELLEACTAKPKPLDDDAEDMPF